MVSHAAPLTSAKLRDENRSTMYAMAIYDAPLVDPLHFISKETSKSTYLWLPPSPKRAWVGVGCLEKITADSTDRFQRQKQQSASVFSKLTEPGFANLIPPRARFFGGFSFAEQTTNRASQWSHFSNSEFVLPKWSYEIDSDHAFITVYYPSTSEPETIRRRAFAHLAKIASNHFEPSRDLLQLVEQADAASEWSERITSIQKSIESGEVGKVVAARQTELHGQRAIDVRNVLENLRQADPKSTIFSFPSGEGVFIGATPETLVRKVNNQLYTEALAGTVNAESSNADNKLQNSDKDQDEHKFVRDYILSKIENLCVSLTVDPEPTLRRLKDVMHLCTAISGELADDRHILDLVEALHPTPAVAGMPVNVAQSMINQNEPFSRGWYSGPIGWFDRSGDGEFAVALRCGLINGSKAHLFAGAGIVRESETTSEYEETRLKQQPLLRALRQG